MAETRAIAQLTPEIWDDQFSTEFFQTNPFAAYSGTSENNIIRMKEDLASKRADGITFEFITSLEKGAIKGRTPLKGSESQMGEYGDKVLWDMRKKAISLHELDLDLAAIDPRAAARENLKAWAEEDVKLEVIDRLLDVGATCDIPYALASAADRNAWNAANADRVLYGAAKANFDATHATALANVDAAADKLSRASVSLLKRIALLARPRITPLRVEKKNRRFFIAFVHPYAFRDLKAEVESVRATVNVVEQNEGIFLGGDLDYDGVLVHEVDDMPLLAGAGNAGIDVASVYLCGQEALGWGVKSRYRSREDTDDYEQVKGLGMIGKWGMKKLAYRFGTKDAAVIGKQRGMVTGFFAATGD
jgi:N4-gp56 family major capsid protein